jgi:hypothetical protein
VGYYDYGEEEADQGKEKERLMTREWMNEKREGEEAQKLTFVA